MSRVRNDRGVGPRRRGDHDRRPSFASDDYTRRRRFASDDRGVSTAVGYVLALAITALLISGLIVAGGNFLDGQRDRVVRDQLNVLGERVASGVENADRMAGAADDSPVVFVRVALPSRAASTQYRIRVDNTTGAMASDRPYAYDLVLEAVGSEAAIEQRVPIRTHHRMIERTVTSGDVVVGYYDETGDGRHELVVRKDIPESVGVGS